MLKKELYMLIKKQLDENINQLKNQINSLKKSRNTDTKSSMGDKYETSREMIQIEINKLEKRLFDAQQKRYVFASLNMDKPHKKIKTGSLIETNNGRFFISVGLGKIQKENLFAISPSSPIGRVFIDKKKGDVFSFQEREYVITDVF